jgi:hypothetical protein
MYFKSAKKGCILLDDIIIPPVPSRKNKHENKPADSNVSINYELPAFEEHELGVGRDEELEKELEHQVEPDEAKPEYAQLPFEVVHKVIRATCLIALVAWFVLIVLLSIKLGEPLFYILIGLSPVILTIIVTYILVDKYHLESGFLMVFPIIFTGIFLVLGMSFYKDAGLHYMIPTSIDIIFGLLFEVAVLVQYSLLRRQRKIKRKEEPEEVKEVILEKPEIKKTIVQLEDDEGVKSFVSSIEDKAKAINAVIGRVYSVKHGGSDELRKEIRIDAEHYNEFSELKDEKPDLRKPAATRLLRKIKERLELLQHPEVELFGKKELASLINLQREPEGRDAIIDVLMKNDKDPVSAYYQGALDFCDEALKELENTEDNSK